ncbi:OmpA domain protein [Roseibacterium elongatum DSM 19469]|uniref:OmpA domain protein n=1 Tax=Roseicyclus elongatus DSM 19469 TaxID=1294273 RepID=W8RQ06_9RHOB|nr:OmpA family protein [Roseibacterium elongatum]AHM03128.1 OmpA domain protein [Roseibacterium elongatum DSM 19469]
MAPPPTEADAFRAVSRAGAIVDADRVVNRLEIAVADTATAPRFSLDMLRNGDGIQLIGLVPASTGRDAVVSAISEVAEGTDVTDMVEAADYPAPESWGAALDYGLRALQQLPRSKVTIFADRVEVEAISENAEQRAAFLAALERNQPEDIEIILDISAPRPVITPFALRVVRDTDGTRFETCAADTQEALERIVDAGRAAGVTGDIDCTIGLGVPSPRWAAAVVRGLESLSELEAGTLTFSDADVTLVGAAGMAQDTFDRLVGELDADLPPVFSLQGVLPDTRTEAGVGPSRLFANLDAENGVTLRGRLPEGAIGRSVQAFAIATFGRDRTDLATRDVADLPQGWSIRAMAGLRALAELHEGQLTLEPDTLRLSGRTGDPELISALTRQLSEDLGPGADFQLDVAYDEELDPIAALPTAEECVAQIQAVQDDAKIIFDPGSVEINEASGAILDQIAEILPNCLHIRMEIGGHTDSQGREEMNLNLSQSRADAVLNGLLARGVLISNLTAQGYGESQPIASNETEEGRERNRRIEFRLLAAGTEDTTAANGADDAAADDDASDYPFEFRPRPRPDAIAEAAEQEQEE